MTTAATLATRNRFAETIAATPRAEAEIRVLHVINGEHYAGAERVQDLLAAELPDCRVSVDFACLKHGKFAAVRKSTHGVIHNIAMRGRFDLRAVWRLVKLIRRGGYHAIHSHGPRAAFIAALASKWTGLPLIHHVHSPTTRDTTDRLRCAVNALVEQLAFAQASAVAAVSESLGRYLRDRGVAEEKLHVIPNGVPSAAEPQSSKPCSTACQSDSLQATWTIGTVALFRPRKGLEVLLTALAKLKQQGFLVRLRAVGGFETQEYERQIKQLAEQLGVAQDVDWTGFTTDVATEMRSFDVFVLPSLFGEGMPMVVLEAMAAGLPIVASEVEGVPEAVRDGVEGVLVRPGDADALATGLARLFDGTLDPSRLGTQARRRHDERFSSTAMARATADLYRRVLAAT